MNRRRTAFAGLAWSLLASGAGAADSLVDDLHLETHGFVSFGYLKSWGNNWLGDTLDGTNEFWEAAANVTARPMDRLRLGAQLFTRDLGIYGNAKVELDWAYADWRVADEFGVQLGRVKMPRGLHSDEIDIDVAHSAVFLPRSFLYNARARDIQQSTDGGKLYGTSGPLDWAVFLGNKHFANDSDFAKTLILYNRVLSQVTDIDTDYSAGFMAHWRTPVPSLEVHLSGSTLQGLEVDGVSVTGTAAVKTLIPEFYLGSVGLVYELGDFTWKAEYVRVHAAQHIIITPFSGAPTIESRSVIRDENAYLSLTWHAQRWLDLYAAVEGLWNDPANRHGSLYSQNAVAAVAVMPTAHWSLKAEYRFMHGTKDFDASLNPGGADPDTHVLALKTTVDF